VKRREGGERVGGGVRGGGVERVCREKAGKMKVAGDFTGKGSARQRATVYWSSAACSSCAAPLLAGIAAAIGAVGHKAGNNQPLNLLRSFVNLKNLCVSHQFFDGILAVVAIPAKYLRKKKQNGFRVVCVS
jgi:hypothetical protein